MYGLVSEKIIRLVYEPFYEAVIVEFVTFYEFIKFGRIYT